MLILIRFQDELNSGRVAAWPDHAGLPRRIDFLVVQQAHHRLQLRQFEILPAQRHLHPLLQLGQADQDQAAVAQAQWRALQVPSP